MKLLVTVGTTKFDQLVKIATSQDFLDFCINCGFHDIAIQHGRIDFPLDHLKFDGLELFDYCSDLQPRVAASDVVISHAGAGTIMECLHMNKALIVVPNDRLMDNHQLELAQKLEEERHLLVADCKLGSLKRALNDPMLFQLDKFDRPVQAESKLARYLSAKLFA
eukprot:Partr_v1_DN26790_c1_g1_i2_m8890 putative UDP-N-acetylglucosamine transferase subunit ALG13